MTSQPVLQQASYEVVAHSCTPSRKIHVCYILGSLKDGGTEHQALELMRNLDSTRFTISLIIFEDAGREKIPDTVSTHYVLHIPQESSKWFSGLIFWTLGAKRIYSQLKIWQPDIVHAFLAGPSILGVVPAHLARVPVFIGSRRSLVGDYRRKRRLASLADIVALKLADLNLANSTAVGKEMVSSGCAQEKCLTLYNGVDTARFNAAPSSDWRNAMGWDDSHIVFGIIANFYAYKRHTDFVKAAAIILQKHPHARFVMVGTDYGTKKRITQEVDQLGLNFAITIADGISHPEIIFAAIDVLVCTSETEGLSNVLLEAMASGKPVIATDVGGNPEIVIDGETGILVPLNSPQAVADAAEQIILDPDHRSKMGIHARRRVQQHFSLESMVEEHERLYIRLADKFLCKAA